MAITRSHTTGTNVAVRGPGPEGMNMISPYPSPSPAHTFTTASPYAPSPVPSNLSIAGLRLPLSPDATIHYFRDVLTPYEMREIFEYSEIYYVGAASVIKVGSPRRRTGADGLPAGSVSKEDAIGIFNDGYDDSHGDYYLTIHDHIGYRYEIVSLLGKGSFGQVARCFDHKTKTYVAIKMIRNKKRFEKQGVVEVKVLDKIRKEDSDDTQNVIHMVDSFYFRHHLCITTELLGTNLYEWIKAGGFRGVHSGVIKRFTVQIVESMILLYKHRIVHCDLKPENILLKDQAFTVPNRCDLITSGTDSRAGRLPADFDAMNPIYDIKTIDFGSSCFEHEKIYTYVQSRFYRCPEVILGINYNMAIDMWSLGCILAELLTGYPLFPGENEQEQMACIMEIKGLPPPQLVERGSRRKLFFESNGMPRPYTNSKGKRRRPGTKSLAGVIRYADPLLLDFIEKCLEWEPERRMVPDQALRHDWLREYIGYGRSPAVVQLQQEIMRFKYIQQQQQQQQQFLLHQQQLYEHQQTIRRHPSMGSRESTVGSSPSDGWWHPMASPGPIPGAAPYGMQMQMPSTEQQRQQYQQQHQHQPAHSETAPSSSTGTSNTWRNWRKSQLLQQAGDDAGPSAATATKSRRKPSLSIRLGRSKSHGGQGLTSAAPAASGGGQPPHTLAHTGPALSSSYSSEALVGATGAAGASPYSAGADGGPAAGMFPYVNHNGPPPPPPISGALMAQLAAARGGGARGSASPLSNAGSTVSLHRGSAGAGGAGVGTAALSPVAAQAMRQASFERLVAIEQHPPLGTPQQQQQLQQQQQFQQQQLFQQQQQLQHSQQQPHFQQPPPPPLQQQQQQYSSQPFQQPQFHPHQPEQPDFVAQPQFLQPLVPPPQLVQQQQLQSPAPPPPGQMVPVFQPQQQFDDAATAAFHHASAGQTQQFPLSPPAYQVQQQLPYAHPADLQQQQYFAPPQQMVAAPPAAPVQQQQHVAPLSRLIRTLSVGTRRNR
ncbi:Dual specificity tyrosine-phosphorylation-regulated kinase [Cladochytrium tenue]|nr:Dual specificity tyrosine-phosphorylation-regulated kinase [Cladochytrium tenue]